MYELVCLASKKNKKKRNSILITYEIIKEAVDRSLFIHVVMLYVYTVLWSHVIGYIYIVLRVL